MNATEFRQLWTALNALPEKLRQERRANKKRLARVKEKQSQMLFQPEGGNGAREDYED